MCALARLCGCLWDIPLLFYCLTVLEIPTVVAPYVGEAVLYILCAAFRVGYLMVFPLVNVKRLHVCSILRVRSYYHIARLNLRCAMHVGNRFSHDSGTPCGLLALLSRYVYCSYSYPCLCVCMQSCVAYLLCAFVAYGSGLRTCFLHYALRIRHHALSIRG